MARKKIIVIVGPTASGKSQLALAIAQESDAVIINADSMQVYTAIPVLSAQPDANEQSLVPHKLYSILDATASCSVGVWLALAKEAIDAALMQGKQPIVVGGTGLYIKSLLRGISPIPDIDESVRNKMRTLFMEIGNTAFHALLEKHDPIMAKRLPPGDSQRMIRSMEVLEQTGISLAQWHEVSPVSYYNQDDFTSLTLIPPRTLLYHNCDSRFRHMLKNGALDEVRSLMQAELPPTLPVMKTLGVQELRRYLNGEITQEDAISLAQTSTRHYAKRQLTWFRHQIPESHIVSYENTQEEQQSILRSCL